MITKERRIQVTLPEHYIRQIDRVAKSQSLSRGRVVGQAWREHLSRKDSVMKVLEEIWAKIPPSDLSEEELDEEIDKAVHEVRAEKARDAKRRI